MKHYEAQSKTLKNKFANNHTNSIDNFAYAKHGLSKIKGAKKRVSYFILNSANLDIAIKRHKKNPILILAKLLSSPLFKF